MAYGNIKSPVYGGIHAEEDCVNMCSRLETNTAG